MVEGGAIDSGQLAERRIGCCLYVSTGQTPEARFRYTLAKYSAVSQDHSVLGRRCSSNRPVVGQFGRKLSGHIGMRLRIGLSRRKILDRKRKAGGRRCTTSDRTGASDPNHCIMSSRFCIVIKASWILGPFSVFHIGIG